MKIKIKKGDTVSMRSGKDAGKSGKVLHVDPTLARVTVEGLNLVKKHVKPRKQGEKGELISVPRSVPLGTVGLFCTRCDRTIRVGIKVEPARPGNGPRQNDFVGLGSGGGEKRTRVCKRCGNTIERS